MRFLGIDPGVSGALAVLESSDVLVSVEDLPIIRDGATVWCDAGALLSRLINLRGTVNTLHAIVERQGAQPVQGVASAFKMGVGYGSILAALQIARISITFVTPTVWKRHYGLSQDKNASLHKARLLYPTASLDRKKDHGRAEALLLARYGIWGFGQTRIEAERRAQVGE